MEQRLGSQSWLSSFSLYVYYSGAIYTIPARRKKARRAARRFFVRGAIMRMSDPEI